jgi:DNA-binding PadR family transcriptional regulator
MTVRLVLLGLLCERPLYGYEIKQIIEEHMGDWTSIAFGSIYFALDKLAEDEFVKKIGTEQPGNRPSRSVYEITDTGRAEFFRLLRESWQTVEREYFDIDVCLFFIDRLPEKEVQKYLQMRKSRLEKSLGYLLMHEKEQTDNPNVPAQAVAIFNHTRMHLQSELDWTISLLNKE